MHPRTTHRDQDTSYPEDRNPPQALAADSRPRTWSRERQTRAGLLGTGAMNVSAHEEVNGPTAGSSHKHWATAGVTPGQLPVYDARPNVFNLKELRQFQLHTRKPFSGMFFRTFIYATRRPSRPPSCAMAACCFAPGYERNRPRITVMPSVAASYHSHFPRAHSQYNPSGRSP